MSEKIVVAVDGGTASEAALDWAIERARTVDLNMEILTVVDIDWLPQPGTDAVIAEHERLVLEAGNKVAASGVSVPWSTTVHHDRPISGLVAASRRADILVIGSHKTRAAIGLIHGTLPLAIAARTQSPLVVVPVGWVPSGGPVVVGVDDQAGWAAMRFAASEAERAAATLVAVRAWMVPPLVYGAWAAIDSPVDECKAVEQAVLDSMVERTRKEHEGLTIDPVLEYGRPSLVLAEHAGRARLSVVGSHGRGVVAGLLLGSVGHDLLMNLAGPVAIVPDADPDRPERLAVADDEALID